jgi:hypothetical protein
MVGAIEEFVRTQLGARLEGQLAVATPALMHLLVAPYLGDAAARAELSRAAPKPSRAGL